MATNKIQTGLRLNEMVYKKLLVLAGQESRSLNNLVEHIVKLYIDRHEAEHGPIQIPDEG